MKFELDFARQSSRMEGTSRKNTAPCLGALQRPLKLRVAKVITAGTFPGSGPSRVKIGLCPHPFEKKRRRVTQRDSTMVGIFLKHGLPGFDPQHSIGSPRHCQE